MAPSVPETAALVAAETGGPPAAPAQGRRAKALAAAAFLVGLLAGLLAAPFLAPAEGPGGPRRLGTPQGGGRFPVSSKSTRAQCETLQSAGAVARCTGAADLGGPVVRRAKEWAGNDDSLKCKALGDPVSAALCTIGMQFLPSTEPVLSDKVFGCAADGATSAKAYACALAKSMQRAPPQSPSMQVSFSSVDLTGFGKPFFGALRQWDSMDYFALDDVTVDEDGVQGMLDLLGRNGKLTSLYLSHLGGFDAAALSALVAAITHLDKLQSINLEGAADFSAADGAALAKLMAFPEMKTMQLKQGTKAPFPSSVCEALADAMPGASDTFKLLVIPSTTCSVEAKAKLAAAGEAKGVRITGL